VVAVRFQEGADFLVRAADGRGGDAEELAEESMLHALTPALGSLRGDDDPGAAGPEALPQVPRRGLVGDQDVGD
jgi:hypothetical protein